MFNLLYASMFLYMIYNKSCYKYYKNIVLYKFDLCKNIFFVIINIGNIMENFDVKKLIELSFDAQKNSYAPYSKFNVGASLLCGSGKIYLGANIENASYPTGICAERVAYSKAISEGEKDFVAICITSSGNQFAYPCGVCRQFMSEFSLDTKIIVAKSPNEYEIHTLKELLPFTFDLEK